MRRQATIIQSHTPQEPSGPRDKKGRKQSKHGTANGKAPFGEEDAFTRLITEKPSKKRVLEYFRGRIAELVAADEF